MSTAATQATDCPIDRITPTQRPSQRVAGYHVWSDLLFLHWRVPVEMLRPLVPPELTIDTFNGEAWVGLVPFRMSGVRPWWAPALPWLSSFPETNVRTYVHFEGRDPGVWFMSLDAANPIAVAAARTFWNLNYRWAVMSVKRDGEGMTWQSCRRNRKKPAAALIRAGSCPSQSMLAADGSRCDCAEPETLNHFLIERYILFAKSGRGGLYRGHVHHDPYQITVPTVESCEETLLAANGIDVSGPPEHVAYSPGVDVEVYGLERIRN